MGGWGVGGGVWGRRYGPGGVSLKEQTIRPDPVTDHSAIGMALWCLVEEQVCGEASTSSGTQLSVHLITGDWVPQGLK